MNVVAKVKQSTDLAVIETISASVVFVPGGVDSILGKIEAEVRGTKTDISTASGRAAVASLAYKVARSKTALDEMGKDLVSELKAKTGAIDAERRTIRDRLDALKDEVRRPLTEWEDADKNRIAAHEAALFGITNTTSFLVEPGVHEIESRIAHLSEMPPRDWQEFSARAKEAYTVALGTLTGMRDRAIKREADQAELERLRREQIEREQRERDERIAAEAAERARAEAEAKAAREAEAAAARAKAEQERVEAERHAARLEAVRAENERREAQLRADAAEAARVEQAAQAERDKKAAAEAAEKRRLQAIEDERKRAVDEKAREAAETAKREANKKHRAKINNEVLGALVVAGLSEDAGKLAITAIAQGSVPHTRISY